MANLRGPTLKVTTLLLLAVRAAARATAETAYPPRCAGCGRRGCWVCDDCDEALPRFSPPWCERCGVPGRLGRCRCGDLPPSLDAVRSVAPLAGWLRPAVHAFKYENESARGLHLARAALEGVSSIGPVDALVPVPLHRERLRRRGYNQSAILAGCVGELLGVPVVSALVRVRPTAPQVGLGAEERALNVAGAFEVDARLDVAGLRVLLVDDVITTGSTLGGCAASLRGAGADAVWALTLGREL